VKTGSLRTRVAAATLALLAVVLAAVVAAVTLAYRAKLEGDLRARLSAAGAAVESAGSGSTAKPLVQGLALEGIATHIGRATEPPLPPGKGGPAAGPVKPGTSIQTRGSLLVLDQILRDGTEVRVSASRASIDHAVTSLLLVEVLVAASAFAVAALLVLRLTRSALQPLSQVIDAATKIAAGDSSLRLRPDRTDTEVGSMAVAFDRMVDALETAIAEAQASEQATRRFLADASHELRTPIAALQASAESLLREQPQRPKRDQLEAALARDAARLGRLVDDLLGLARLQASPALKPVRLEPLARSAIEQAQERSPDAQLTLTLNGDATALGDADALARVFRNLIDNALAATDGRGEVKLHLATANGTIKARVTDNGPGVPEPERERIFERFVRLDPSQPGSGLGLAISRRIARHHNGELTCDPHEDGASFTLQLPAT
jgi:signal transduction histidine kinase